MTNAIKAEEYFYAAKLDKKEPITIWQPLEWEPEQRLQLRQIMLGHTAKENEFNVIEVEAPSVKDVVKIPIAVLKIGEQRVVQMNLEFPDGPVKFNLIEGSGPIYIHGQYIPPDTGNDESYVVDETAAEDDTIEEELMEEEEVEEEEDEYKAEKTHPAKRQKLNDETVANHSNRNHENIK